MSQIIVCLKKYAKDSRMVYYFRLEFEVQIDAHEDSIRTTNTHKKCLKTTNMADMRDQRTGRERDLSEK